MTAQNDKQIEKRISSILSTVDQRTNKPDKQFLDKLKEQSTAEFLAFSKDGNKQSEKTIPISKWRIIMKSRITKLAAAATIVVAVLTCIYYFVGSIDGTTKVYGIIHVPKVVRQAETIHIKGWRSRLKVPVLGEEQNRHHTEDWIDLKNGKYHTMGFGLVRNADTKTTRAIKLAHVFDGQYRMQINHSSKRVQFSKLSEFQRRLSVRKMVNRFLEEIFLSTDQLTGFVQCGSEQIDGVNFDVWERVSSASEDSEQKFKYLVSPASGSIRKFQYWEKSAETSGEWQLTSENEIELNLTPPEGVFTTVAPEGYRLNNTKESAFKNKLIALPIRHGSITGAINIIIALPNDSVIIGWHTNDVSHAELLRNLSPGDELPMEGWLEIVYGLRRANNPDNITYVTRHLACTEKDGILYEWDIYVPNTLIAAKGRSRECQITTRLQSEHGEETEEPITILTDVDLLIEQDEFDTFVRGAMAELSDDGKASEHVTYENVLQLAKEIRNSLNK
ncbi:MAG: hypothetical protein WBC05_15145 [Sedimentisphaerales bacterium]